MIMIIKVAGFAETSVPDYTASYPEKLKKVQIYALCNIYGDFNPFCLTVAKETVQILIYSWVHVCVLINFN